MHTRLPIELELSILELVFRSFAEDVKPYYLPSEWEKRESEAAETSLLNHSLLQVAPFPSKGGKTPAREFLGNGKLVCKHWERLFRKVESECRRATIKNTRSPHLDSDFEPYAHVKVLRTLHVSDRSVIPSLVSAAPAFTMLTAFSTTDAFTCHLSSFCESLPRGNAQLSELAVGGISFKSRTGLRLLVNLRRLEIGHWQEDGRPRLRVQKQPPFLDIMEEVATLPLLEHFTLIRPQQETRQTLTDIAPLRQRLREIEWQGPLKRLRIVHVHGLGAELAYLLLARFCKTLSEADLCFHDSESNFETALTPEDHADFPCLRQLRLSLAWGLWNVCTSSATDQSLHPLVNPLTLVIQDSPSLSRLALSSTYHLEHHGFFRHPRKWWFFEDLLKNSISKLEELEVHCPGSVIPLWPRRSSSKSSRASTEPQILSLLGELEKKGTRCSWTEWIGN